MTIEIGNYSVFLEKVAADIDIPPLKYKQAVERYGSVGRWLEEGQYAGCQGPLAIYVQGSFRLGTVIRPVIDGIEANYDIDLVSELPIEKAVTTPKTVKTLVGDRLRDHGTYKKLLEPEGRRCWTLEYAEQDGVGFHLDVLPCVPNRTPTMDTAIAITDRDGTNYAWSASNPRGFGAWFDGRNAVAFSRVRLEQKQELNRRFPMAFDSVDQVPDLLVRTPLQRAIQIMKRHRDERFNHKDRIGVRPISVIITTLAARLYNNETDVLSALRGIVSKLGAHSLLVENRAMDSSIAAMNLIQRLPDGRWYIGNPSNPQENFADRWHENNHAKARAFFEWVRSFQQDFLSITGREDPRLLQENLSQALGAAVVTKNFGLLVPARPIPDAPRIQITKPAEPWGHG